MVVREVAGKYSSQVGVVEYDDLIEAFSTDTSNQAFNVGVLAKLNCEQTDVEHGEQAFVAGLLHDVGTRKNGFVSK